MAVGLVAAGVLVVFYWYFDSVRKLVSPTNLEEIGQFGDAFGFWTSVFTLLALIGLIVQLRMTHRQHEESMSQQRQQHAADIKEQDRKHQELLKLQIDQHQEMLKQQKLEHEAELAVQRMTLVGSEHPVLQSTSFSLLCYPLEDPSGKDKYLIIWKFFHDRRPMARNPVFVFALKDPTGALLSTGICRPGQLSVSNCNTYEATVWMSPPRALQKDDVCEVSVLYQNSLGCSFRYRERFRLVMRLSQGRIVSQSNQLILNAEMAFAIKPPSQILSPMGHFGDGFFKTDDPIVDMPIVDKEWNDEQIRLQNLAKEAGRGSCIAVFDDKKSDSFIG